MIVVLKQIRHPSIFPFLNLSIYSLKGCFLKVFPYISDYLFTSLSWSCMTNQPQVAHKFQDVEPRVQEQVKALVQKNIDGKLDSYLKKIYNHKTDAEIRIEYKLIQNKQKKYECSFVFDFDGKKFVYDSKVAFKFPEDLVNHAFKHFKEYLSKHETKPE